MFRRRIFKSLIEISTMKIGLYFGSFNPVHTGHCIIASHVVSHTALDQIWFVISPQNPFKKSNALLNEYDRLYLVQLALEGETLLKASDIEFGLPRPSYTSDTLIYLHEKYPQHEFALVMGSDGFQNLNQWKNAELIMRNYPIYVYKRPGFHLQNNTRLSQELPDAPQLLISSTHIRECIKQKKSIRYLVPEKVKDEIEKNGYYR